MVNTRELFGPVFMTTNVPINNEEQCLLGNELAGLRKRANLSQQDIAGEIGVNKSNISQVENGYHSSPRVVSAIIHATKAYDEILEDTRLKELVARVVPSVDFQDFLSNSSYGHNSGSKVADIEHQLDKLRVELDSALMTTDDVIYQASTLVEETAKEEKMEALRHISKSASIHDKYTGLHNKNVSVLNKVLGQRMGLEDTQIDILDRGGVLHDIGKIAVPTNLLHKRSKLADEEFDEIKIHPSRGWDFIKEIGGLEELKPCILYHHEKLDGSGYPEHLEGEEIPIEARITAVSDIFDALTTDRPYREAHTTAEALQIMEGLVLNNEIDPDVTMALVELVEKKLLTRDNDLVIFTGREEEIEGEKKEQKASA